MIRFIECPFGNCHAKEEERRTSEKRTRKAGKISSDFATSRAVVSTFFINRFIWKVIKSNDMESD